MNIPQLTANDKGIYHLTGDLTFYTVTPLWHQGEKMLDGDHKDVTIDLSAVEHIDSAAIALLLDWLRKARQHQVNLHFSHVPAQMRAIMQVCNLSSLFTLDAE